MLELSALVAFPPGVRGADVNGIVRPEQSRERVLGDWLLAPAGPPFGPGTALDPDQLVSEP